MILETSLDSISARPEIELIDQATKTLQDRGCEISVVGSFDLFQTVDRDGALTFGAYHPKQTHAARGMSVVIRRDGKPIATGAGALFDTYERSMADLFLENGIFDNPDRDEFTLSDTCHEWLACVSGRVLYSGGIWIEKEWRGSELSDLIVPLIPLIVRTVGVEAWGAQHIISLVEKAIVTKGVARRYRVWFTKPGAVWANGGRDIPMVLTYTAPIQAKLDARRFINLGPEQLLSPSSLPMNIDSARRAA